MPDPISTALLVALNFEASVPEWVELIPAPDAKGEVHGRDGRWWRMSNPQAIIENFAANRRDIVFDFEHASEIKAPNGDPAPAAGWIKELRLAAGGSVEGRVDWTERGRHAVESREYRYLSPVIEYTQDSLEILAVSSAGLTNQQNLFNRALNAEGAATQEPDTMNEKQLIALRASLGLSETATAEEILTAANSMSAAKTKAEGDLATALNRADHPSIEKFVPRSDHDAAVNRAINAEKKLEDAAKVELETAINREIDDALKAGKIVPANKDYYVAQCKQDGGLEAFRGFVKTAPVIGDPSKMEEQPAPEASETALNSEEKQVAEAMGVSIEDLQATKKEQASA